jgi:putative membrane protein
MDEVYVSAVMSALHLLALAIGLPGVVLRGLALRSPLDAAGFKRLFAADTAWGVAFGLWVISGLLRAFAGLEQGSQYYLDSPLFWVKMSLLGVVLLLEIRPMTTFIRWRTQLGHGQTPNTEAAPSLYRFNQIQAGLIVIMVFTAAFMARGVLR